MSYKIFLARKYFCLMQENILADDTDDGIGICGWILTAISWAMVVATLPFSLCVCFKVSSARYCVGLTPQLLCNNRKRYTFCTQDKVFMRYFQVVQEYERAVIFRLGRLLSGGSKGPGKFFSQILVIHCNKYNVDPSRGVNIPGTGEIINRD